MKQRESHSSPHPTTRPAAEVSVGVRSLLPRRWLMWALLCFGGLAALCGGACNASSLTDRMVIREGPPLNFGRMSASLGIAKLKDGRVVIVGGSPREYPFVPLTGKQSIEVLDNKWTKWETVNIDIPYQISGAAYPLPDGRIFVYNAVFTFNPKSQDTTPFTKLKRDQLPAAPVAAVLIDVDKKTFTPIYRAKDNVVGNPPLTGKGPGLMQGTFSRSIQLRDSRIVRVGGRIQAVSLPPKPPTPECKSVGNNKFCRYCKGKKCTPHPDGEYTCKATGDCPIVQEFSAQCSKQSCRYCSGRSCYDHPVKSFSCKVVADCPPVGKVKRSELNYIEIYTPPGPGTPLGRVQYVKMKEARRDLQLIELNDGRVFISGGKGPEGEGPENVFTRTYLLTLPKPGEGDRILDQATYLKEGPRMRESREDHANSRLQDGRILLAGGTNGDGISTNRTEIFDPATNTILDGRPMNDGREDLQAQRLGPWVVFLGGEVDNRADQIRNTAEAFAFDSGVHIGSFFLFSRENVQGDQLCPNTKGFAGIDDFASIQLDDTHLMIVGGQQGCQDRDGAYISPGKGSRRSLILNFSSP